MLYPDGAEVRIGDRIRLSNGEEAIIVFSIDTGEYSEELPKADWEYLRRGVMVRTDRGALIHFENESQEEFSFVSKSERPNH